MNLSNGFKIEVEKTGKEFHTLNDWGFALQNNNYIGEPEPITSYISVPGRDGLIDASEAISGRVIYKTRPLSFILGGIRPIKSWDTVISVLRNDINGKICKITIDNDKSHYWRGRVFIEGFDRMRDLGQFTLRMSAEPYKYNVESSIDPWLWDPFNFETGVVTNPEAVKIDGEMTITIPAGHMLVSPEFILTEIKSDVTVTYKGTEYPLVGANTRIPAILVNGDEEVELLFKGDAYVQVYFRGGSL